MNQYKVQVSQKVNDCYVVYKRVFFFFWTEVGCVNTYQVEATIVEQATALVHSKKPYYFEA
jgi:hypothetical protein